MTFDGRTRQGVSLCHYIFTTRKEHVNLDPLGNPDYGTLGVIGLQFHIVNKTPSNPTYFPRGLPSIRIYICNSHTRYTFQKVDNAIQNRT